MVIDTLEEGEEIIEDKFEIRDTIRIEVNLSKRIARIPWKEGYLTLDIRPRFLRDSYPPIESN